MWADALVAVCVAGAVLIVGLRAKQLAALARRLSFRAVGRRVLDHPSASAGRAWLAGALQRAGLFDAVDAERLAGVFAFAGWGLLPLGGLLALLAGAWIPMLLPLLGMLLPLVWLRDRAQKRALALSRELPWTLDLLTLAVEVGMDFNVALARVVERGRSGVLQHELAAVVRELRVGTSRADALGGLRRRTRHAAIGRFCTAVIQAERLGTPLSRVLRAQAADLRIERCQRAEKLAGEAPVKLLAPLLTCIFPTVFLVLLGPIAFSLLVGGGLP